MPNQLVPALSRYGVACALLLLPVATGCGREREPWYGFEVFPAQKQAPEGTAGTVASDDSTTLGGSAADAPEQQPRESGISVGTASTGAAPAADGGATPATPAGSGEAVSTATPATSNQPDAAMPATATVPAGPPTAFRITELQLRDPHVFAGTQDLTEQEVLGESVNATLIPAKLTKDADGDGSIDVSVIALLQPFDPSASPDKAPTLAFVNAKCPVNGGANSACTPVPGEKGLQTKWNLEQRPTGNCLEPIAGTTSSYMPAITVPNGPCFLSVEGTDITIDLGGIKIDVAAAKVSATYQSEPASLVRGLLAGFVTRTAAMQAILPSVPGSIIAGDPLSTYIRQRDYDQSSSPNGQDGFWMYLNFVAKPITYKE